MIKLNIKRTNITASCLETLVEGNVNSVFVEFTFSPEWDNLSRIAVFSNGTSKISVSLSENSCSIPWEVLSCPGELLVAVRGVGDSGNLVICTENASLGKVVESLADDDANAPEDATLSVIDNLLIDVAALKVSGVEGGYIPVKGRDYWTAEDKAEILSEAGQAMSDTYASKDDLTDYQPKETGKGLSTNDYDNAQKQKVADAYADRHTHSNSSVLDGITSVLVAAWNNAVTWVTSNGANVLSHLSDSVKHITSAERTAWNAKSDFSGNYNDLSNKPTIPSLDGYATEQYVQGYHDSAKQDVISDLSTLRTNASKGSTAIQPSSLNKTLNDYFYLDRGTAIQNGDNLNDYDDIGTYYSSTSTVSASLVNCPYTTANFKLLVFHCGSTSFITQMIITGSSNPRIFMRSYVSSGWSSWIKFEGTEA